MHIGNIKTYYGDDAQAITRQRMMDIMTLEIASISQAPLSLKQELIKAAQSLHNQFPDLYIALSGGWESNVCLHTFIEAGIKPNVVIFKFPDGLNDFDVDPALDTCRRFAITPLVIDIPDFKDFLKNHLIKTAEKYQAYTFFQTLIAWYLEQHKINCLIVDKIDLRRDMSPNPNWNFVRSENATWIDRFNAVNDNKVIMNFFCYSPEAMLAYLKLPVIEQLTKNKCSGKLSLQSLKHKIYKEGGYDKLPLYTRTVATDKIIGINSLSEESIKKHVGWRCRIAYIEYKDMVDSLENNREKKWQFIL